jgi:hypothetical protein
VLNKAVWSSRAVAGWLLRLLVGTFLSADATVVIGIDDTIERRCSQHPAVGNENADVRREFGMNC